MGDYFSAQNKGQRFIAVVCVFYEGNDCVDFLWGGIFPWVIYVCVTIIWVYLKKTSNNTHKEGFKFRPWYHNLYARAFLNKL